MFRSTDSFASSSPPSSPVSSPSLGPTDSSPPSSPSLDAIATPPPFGSPSLSHPYAASTKANKRPKLHERRDTHNLENTGSSSDASCDMRRVRPRLRAPSSDSSCGAPLIHPFAASAKTSWRPPRREARYGRVDSTASTSSEFFDNPPRPVIEPLNLGAAVGDDALGLTDDEVNDIHSVNPSRYRVSVVERKAREKELWDDAIDKAIDDANGIVDLSQSGYSQGLLTFIPSSVADLARLVVLKQVPTTYEPLSTGPTTLRRFTRAVTFPASSSDAMSAVAPLAKASSFTYNHVQACVARSVNEIQLFLAGNAIRTLPLELFTLQGLTVLSLRANALTTIPPQITRLTNLRELNLAQNRLRWLPSEMLDMNIPKLTLTNNPWIVPPIKLSARKPVSDISTHFTIPSLVESCLRVLFAPVGMGMDETALELYELPLDQKGFSSELLRIFGACVPGSVGRSMDENDGDSSLSLSPAKGQWGASKRAHPEDSDAAEREGPEAEDLPDIGVCPSPAHRTPQGEWVRGRKPVFVQCAEERYTWEKMGGAETTLIPVRWRGCGRGCLDFLRAEGQDDSGLPVDGLDGSLGLSGGARLTTDEAGRGVQVVDVGVGVGGWADLEEFE